MAPERDETFAPPHTPRASKVQLLLAGLFLIGSSVLGWLVVARLLF